MHQKVDRSGSANEEFKTTTVQELSSDKKTTIVGLSGNSRRPTRIIWINPVGAILPILDILFGVTQLS